MIGLNIRDRSSIDLSLQDCSRQFRISSRMALAALVEIAGVKLTKSLPTPIFRLPRTKRITKKIEFLGWVRSSPIFVLAIDNLRLLRMKLQPTLLQPLRYRIPNFLSLASRPAMHDGVIGIPLKRQMRILPRHPHIERIMQKQIR